MNIDPVLRESVIRCLRDNMGIRRTSRETGVAKETIKRILASLGSKTWRCDQCQRVMFDPGHPKIMERHATRRRYQGRVCARCNSDSLETPRKAEAPQGRHVSRFGPPIPMGEPVEERDCLVCKKRFKSDGRNICNPCYSRGVPSIQVDPTPEEGS